MGAVVIKHHTGGKYLAFVYWVKTIQGSFVVIAHVAKIKNTCTACRYDYVTLFTYMHICYAQSMDLRNPGSMVCGINHGLAAQFWDCLCAKHKSGQSWDYSCAKHRSVIYVHNYITMGNEYIINNMHLQYL